MSVRTVLVLAVLTAIAVAAAAIALGTDTSAARDPRIGERVFPALVERANDVASLEVTSRLGTLTLVRGTGGWTLKESDGYPVEPVKANGAVLDLTTLRFHEPKTARPENFGKLNLLDIDAPGSGAARVRLRDTNGALLADVLAGNAKFNLPGTKTGGVYVRLPGEDRAWLAAGGLNVSGLPSDWLEPTVLHIAGERIRRVRIDARQGTPVIITKRNPQSLVFTLNGVPAGYKLRYEDEPKLIATNLEAFELEDTRRAGAIDFDPNRTARTVFETFDGLVVAAETTHVEGKPWTRFEISAKKERAAGEARALSEQTKDWVYRIADYRAERLTKQFQEMLAPTN